MGSSRRAWYHHFALGFTLIELMVVIALIGIVSAMILPEMRGTYEEALLRSTSRQVVNLCNLAYSEAVSQQQVHRLALDTGTGKFTLLKRDAKARESGGFVLAEIAGGRGELDNRISIRFHRPPENLAENGGPAETEVPAVSAESDVSGRVLLSFYPDGTADPGEIQLQDRDGFRLLLRISPVTSRVRVMELPRQ